MKVMNQVQKQQLSREDVYNLSQLRDNNIEKQKEVLEVLKTSDDSASLLYSIYYFCNIGVSKVESINLNKLFLKFLKDKNQSLCVRDISGYALALFNKKDSTDFMKKIIEEETELLSAFPTFKKNLINYIDYLENVIKLKQV